MRKLVLFGLLIAFAGIGFAETPEIVNPPRPTRKFKWLAVVDFSPWYVNPPGRYYVYTNKVGIRKIEIGKIKEVEVYELVFGKDLEVCWDTTDIREKSCGSQNTPSPEGQRLTITIGHKQTGDVTCFISSCLKARAPKSEEAVLQELEKPKLQKAKVVFR